MDDYQFMNFEFPDENIMQIIDYEEPELYEGPDLGSRWTMVFEGDSNALGNKISVVIIFPQGCYTPFKRKLKELYWQII